MSLQKDNEKTNIVRYEGTISFNLSTKDSTINVVTTDLGDHFAHAIESVRWHLTKTGYVVSKIGSLHRLVYSCFLNRPLSTKEIVDHLNNDARYDCRLENLRLSTTSENVSKGNGLDKKIAQIKKTYSFRFWNFNNGRLEIAVAPQIPGDPYLLINGSLLDVQTVWFDYLDFERCMADSIEIIIDLEKEGRIDCSKLHFDGKSYDSWGTSLASKTSSTDLVIDSDGNYCLVLGEGHAQLAGAGPSPYVQRKVVKHEK